MEDNLISPLVLDGSISGIKFSVSTSKEICTSSANDCPITHPSQLTNPFLGLPLESGKCEACGTDEHGQCEGHFGYIQLPIPVYHPCHITELKHILSLVCLKCLRMKKGKVMHRLGKGKVLRISCSYCQELPPISVKEFKTTDGALCLELQVSVKRAEFKDGFWNFLHKYGFRYGDSVRRPLLPCEALNIFKEIPEDTRKRLAGKGFYPQTGFIMQYVPVPPNCLYSPDFSDGKSIMSSDISISMLKRVINKIELIKRSRSGSPNFESHEVESNDLQAAISQYMHLRGTTKAPHDITRKIAIGTEASEFSTKQWLEKMRTLFISKASGFSSRCVITGDAYRGVNEIGLPLEIATKITFEERVTAHNMKRLQEVVDNRLCVTYRDGPSTYAIAVGSKGHTFLKIGQVVNRRITDGDIVFINKPPSTHKHSLQAFSVYVHDDHTVKINPLICSPLGADFDGDCIHIFYPQSLAAKAEVVELFSVEQQLLSSHDGSLNLQLVNDSLLALKLMQKTSFLKKTTAQQLGMFISPILPPPALFRPPNSGSLWSILQILQTALPALLDCCGERHLIRQSEILKLDFDRDNLQSLFTEITTSIFISKGQKAALNFFNSLQPLLMELLFLEGFSINLKDFDIPKDVIDELKRGVEDISHLLHRLKSTYNELIDLQVGNHLKSIMLPVVNFIQRYSSLGYLIDSKSNSSLFKVVQQLGFLGLQLFDRGNLYSETLSKDMYSHFVHKYSVNTANCPSKAFGLIKSSLFHGLDPYEELVHSLSTREVILRSSRGLTEPGTLFKNLMAILRDVVICYDGTVRNVCSNSVVEFEYRADDGNKSLSFSPAGEPVGVLAATAISNPSYKAVLNSSQSNNSSWELMKEVLLCKVNFRNDSVERRVILFLNECFCGKRFCKENAACVVHSCLKKVILKDCAVDFSIEYQKQIPLHDSSEIIVGLVGHIHLDKNQLDGLMCSIDDIFQKCQNVIHSHGKKKSQLSCFFRKISLNASECCGWHPHQPYDGEKAQFPCLQFSYHDRSSSPCDEDMERTIDVMANIICPVLLDTIIKGDPRVNSTKIIWIGPDTMSWVRSSHKTPKGEVALEVVIEKDVVKRNGDAWKIALDSCLPVMHLIDPNRSIPYGIQQIKELLGISCAFDQSVQRLSTAVEMVAKGVRKEHLMLVAHSMTCTGNLIGFNTAGYRAMFRSLKVQVPFTEATLSAPMKCFERAAEKCHKDLLSSVVASCLWGKPVTIGTGTRFQILWKKQQMADSQDIGKDVYDFLHMVRTTSSKRDIGTACLGVDVDDLAEVGNFEMNLSPDHNLDLGKLSFDDSPKAYCNNEDQSALGNGKLGQSVWETVSTLAVNSDGWHGWGHEKQPDKNNCNGLSTVSAAKSDGCQGWGNEKQTDSKNHNDLPASPSAVKSNGWQGCGNVKQHDTNNYSDTSTPKHGVWCSWDADKVQNQDCQSSKPSEKFGGFSSWNNREAHRKDSMLSDQSDAWGNKKSNNTESGRDEAANSKDMNYWNGSLTKPQVSHPGRSPIWDSNTSNHETLPVNSPSSSKLDAWGNQKSDIDPTEWSLDDTQSDKPNANDLNKNEVQTSWGSPERLNANSHAWGTKNRTGRSSDLNEWNGNGVQSHQNRSMKSHGWGSSSAGDHRTHKNHSGDQRGWNASGHLTTTGRRLDFFTCEEENILVDVDPIMQSIKRILHQSSYNDGDRVSAEDQTYILDNVFQYHPDKNAKVAGEVSYVMVDRHNNFQESRCFFVVSSDGSSADFSYLKCMENFVREKYPDHGESFSRKYFRRRRSDNTKPEMFPDTPGPDHTGNEGGQQQQQQQL